ncbi:MAG: amidohydrolase, partial [Myxococcota bacterium]
MLRGVVVSPRGDQVAYEALGHIYTRTLPDGTPKRLTRDNSRFEHAPAYSSDGKRIVFATWSDRELGDIRSAAAGGGSVQVLVSTPGHYVDPELSPDGTLVVYERVSAGYLMDGRYSQHTGLFAQPLGSGAKEFRITKDGAGAHFAGASDRLYFLRASGDETSDTRELLAYDLQKRTERVLYTSGAAQSYRVAPNGRWLAFRERFNLYVAPFVETGRTISIGPKAKGIPVTKLTAETGRHLSWSNDSATLHWSTGPELFSRPLTDAFAFLEGAPEELPEPPVEGRNIGFSFETDRPTGTVAFVGARVVTMNGDEVIENGTVVVKGNRIVSVSAAGDDVPAGATIIDAKGKTIVPGFIDAHAHGALGRHGIIPQHIWSQYANLAFGVTTIHDPSNDTETFFAASELQRKGMTRAPRLFSTGKILYGAAGAEYKAQVESFDDAMFHLKRLKAVGAFSVKSYNQPRRDQRQMILE